MGKVALESSIEFCSCKELFWLRVLGPWSQLAFSRELISAVPDACFSPPDSLGKRSQLGSTLLAGTCVDDLEHYSHPVS